eukprot:GHVP01043940.1.p1 GENE.GHVP01043940.1~~GHVP01043940.1.p1  ORF type:complete len:380 (+),score=68.11 GHVP01043940.1:2-1141(+)
MVLPMDVLYFPLMFNLIHEGVRRTEKAGYLVLDKSKIGGLINSVSGTDPRITKSVRFSDANITTEDNKKEEEVKFEDIDELKKKFDYFEKGIEKKDMVKYDSMSIPILDIKDIVFGRVIGKGGNSVIYAAKKIGNPYAYAVKIPAKALHRGYIKEAYIQKEANSEFTVNVIGFIRKKKKLYLALEYQDGEVLSKIVEERLFSEKKAKFIIKKLIAGVVELHSKGIYHLDLSADNVFYSPDRSIKIGDFGDSKILMENHHEHMSKYYKNDKRDNEPCEFCTKGFRTLKNIYEMSDWIGVGRITYSILFGSVSFPRGPFNWAKIIYFDSNQNSPFSIPSKTIISDEAIDFIKKISSPTYTELIGKDGVIKHPWLVNESPDI